MRIIYQMLIDNAQFASNLILNADNLSVVNESIASEQTNEQLTYLKLPRMNFPIIGGKFTYGVNLEIFLQL